MVPLVNIFLVIMSYKVLEHHCLEAMTRFMEETTWLQPKLLQEVHLTIKFGQDLMCQETSRSMATTIQPLPWPKMRQLSTSMTEMISSKSVTIMATCLYMVKEAMIR